MSISRLWGNFFYQSQDFIIDRLERICLLQPHIVFTATQERQCQKMSSSAGHNKGGQDALTSHVTCVTLYPQYLFLGIIRILTLADLADLSITKGDYSQAMIFTLATNYWKTYTSSLKWVQNCTDNKIPSLCILILCLFVHYPLYLLNKHIIYIS